MCAHNGSCTCPPGHKCANCTCGVHETLEELAAPFAPIMAKGTHKRGNTSVDQAEAFHAEASSCATPKEYEEFLIRYMEGGEA